MQIICIRYGFLISYDGMKKDQKKELHKKWKYKFTMNVIP